MNLYESINTNLKEAKKAERFKLEHADSDKISELEKGSAFTWEGMAIDDKNLNGIVDFFEKNTKGFKTPVTMYNWTGKEFNEKYGLTGNNAYPDDLNFLSIPLDAWSEMGNLPMVKFQVGARWLDDIVDNNARREGKNESDCSLQTKMNEAQITDYIPEQKLGELIKKNPVLGKVAKSYKCLDGMLLQVNTDAGVSLYKVVATPNGLEAYWIDKSGKKLGDTFKLTESLQELDTWVDPRSKVDGWKVKILDVYPDEKGNAVAKVEVFNPEGESTGEDTTFINRQKVKIGETYDAYIDGIMAMPRVKGVDDFDYEEIKGKGKELYEEAIPEDPYAYLTEEELTEAANPENAKVNELIRGSLSSIENAKKNAKKLEKYGIQTKYTTYSDRDTDEPRNLDEIPDVNNDYGNISSAFLIGPKGRKLKIDSYRSDDVDKVTKVEYKDSLASKQTGHKTDKYDNTLTQKTYKPSKDEVSAAKAELPKLKRRLNLYNRRYGEDHEYTKDLKKEIKKLEDTINKGIVPSRKEGKVNDWSSRTEPISTIHPDADLKNYLDKEPQDTRFEYPSERAMNPTVAKYKAAKADENYANKEEERNKEYDKRDQEDINDRIRRAKEDKARRDEYVKNIRDRANADLAELRSRIDKMKKRRHN